MRSLNVVSLENGGFWGFLMRHLYLKLCLGEVWWGGGVCGAAVVAQDVLWEGAQVLTPVMLQRPFETASCFPVGLIGKAAEASLERGKKKKRLCCYP